MRYASVCSGVEAASLAWMPLGWEAVFFAEIEPFPCAVLKERFPGVPNLGDMTEIKGEKYYGTVDLLVGGTPCQGFSVAGKQGGLNDSRSALCLAYCGLLETMRPRWFVWENVPGVFSTNQGDDFRAFLGKIDEIGYSVAWRVLDAQYVRVDGYPRAVPQRRRRVFVVGYLGDWRYPASVLFEPEGVHRDTPPRRTKRQSASAGSEGGSASTVWWDGSQKADTLTRTSDQQFIKSVEVSQSIVARMGTGGNNLPLVQECFPINSMVIGKNVKVGDRQTTGIGNAGDPLPTISSAHHHAVVVAENIIGRKENTGANGTGAQVDLAYTQNAAGVMGVSVNTSVRRLLPVECERLMGFPEVDVLEIGKMTKDEFIAWEISTGNIVVDTENGLVYSTRTGGGRKAEEPILLKGCETPTGYLVVSLREKEDKRQCRIHRIVWIAAHGIPPAGMTIDHIDNNKKNNRLDNLQLMTAVDNSMKAHSDGIVGHKSKITEEQSNEIVTLYQEHAISIRKLAEVYGISKSRVHQLIHRDNWTRIPWRGKSAEDCPDSPRYKACGNSMCVNVMRWIGMRIEKVERRMKGIDNE